MREVTVGDVVDQYQLTALLARSGMASIFKAVDTQSGAVVALKIPHMQFESDVVFFQRFKREEEIGQKLDHPNLVKFLTPARKSRVYMAMEFVEGRSLRAVIGDGKTLSSERALDIARQICDAVVYLHDMRVVHRDLKPENVLVLPSGQVKILDFGIALDQSSRRLTWFGLSNPLGTPDYMAPEQISGRRGDARTDVYAIGTMLYEMLTGELPFSSPNPHALLRMKANEEPRPPSYHRPDIDPAIEAIVLRAMARSPRDRYSSAAELLADLRNPGAAAARGPGENRARRQRSWQVALRRVRLPIVVGLVLFALSVLVWASRRPPARHVPPPGAVEAR